MPNHTTNILKLVGSRQFPEIVSPFIKDGNLDFNTLIPMPDELRNTTSPAKIMTQAEIDKQWAEFNALPDDDWRKMEGRPFSLGITQETHDKLIEKYGCNNWYDWAVSNWGTKWNSYDSGPIKPTGMSFYTAWSPPMPVIQRLADVTGETFKFQYLDEGGSFIGEATFSPNKEVEDVCYDDVSYAPAALKNAVGYEEYEEVEDED